MFPDFHDYWDEWNRLLNSRGFYSWISDLYQDIFLRVAYLRFYLCWQTKWKMIATAIASDGVRPEWKPRPPSGGQYLFPLQTRISFDTGGLKAQ